MFLWFNLNFHSEILFDLGVDECGNLICLLGSCSYNVICRFQYVIDFQIFYFTIPDLMLLGICFY